MSLNPGDTVFVINHRATPRFVHPGPVEDVQRAIRFIRHHAARFGIDPARVGPSAGHRAAISSRSRPCSARPASPIAHVSRAAPPTLLLHGDADDTVPYQQSVAMQAALKAAAVPVSVTRVAGGGHGSTFVMNGPHARFPDALRETTAWLDRHLKGDTGRR